MSEILIIFLCTRIVKKNRKKKLKEKLDKKVTDRPAPKPEIKTIADRRHLHNYRVVQRNLVYVIGIPAYCANEDLLRKAEYFGQYGKIGKIVIHRHHGVAQSTSSVYVTFVYRDDARASIQSLEGFWLDGNLLRASFGTTKYCNNFIRGVPCNNPECVYLHELGDDEDRFTKEEIQVSLTISSISFCFIFQSILMSFTNSFYF
jgi:CCR4-NOT transcription complex subunit 4